MGLGDKLSDTSYRPQDKNSENILSRYVNVGVGKCPVKFTEDPLEYCESKDYLGISLRPIQKQFVEDLYSLGGDGLPRFSEGILVCGMRAGKSSVAGMIATFQTHKLLTLDDPAGQLGQLPGDRLTIQCIASSLEQAGETIYAKVEAMLNGTYWWKKYVEWLQKRETAVGGKGAGSLYSMFTNHVEFFEKNVGILALHSNSASLAGKTSYCCIFDELSRFDVAEGNIQQKSQKKTAQAVYTTSTRAATSLMPYSKVVTITSPMYEDDYGMQLLLKAGTFKGGVHSSVVEALRTKEPIKAKSLLGYHFTTFEVNPGYAPDGSRILGGCDESDDFFTSKKEQDPESYRRDYLAIPPSAISPFIEYPERLLACLKKDDDPKVMFSDKIIEDTADLNGQLITRRYIAKDVLVTHPDRMTKYYICVDQGLVADSFVVAMGHGEEFSKKEVDSSGKEREIKAYKVILDFVEKWVPDKQNRLTVNFKNVEDVIIVLSKAFNIVSVCYDTWNSASSIQALFSQGVYTERIGATLEMYEILKQMIYTSLIVMPDDPILVKEIRQLNLIKNIRIDHPSGGCFTGETRIKTLDGHNWTMAELAERGLSNEFWVYACTSTGEIVPAKAYNAHVTKRTRKLCKVELDNGDTIQCTPDHLFMLKDGTYAPAQSLVEGTSLMPCYTRIKEIPYRKGGKGRYTQVFVNNKWAFVHTWVSKKLGFAANTNEVIHHKDINPMNNTPDNLCCLTRGEHSRRHMQISAKAHSPEAIKKRVASFKANYATNIHMQKVLSNNGKKIPKYVQKTNAIKLNSIYWKSEEGLEKRKEIGAKQVIHAREVRMTALAKRILGILASDTSPILSYHHIKILHGNRHLDTNRVISICGNIDFMSNAKKYIGMSIQEALSKSKLTEKQFRNAMTTLGLWDEFIYYNHKVVSVKFITLKSPIPVYDITVPGYNNFALNASVIVHNSKDSADATVRVAYKLYTAYIKDAYQGNYMMPQGQRFPTIRSVASEYDMLNNEMQSGGPSVFGGNFGGGFGKSSSIFDGNIVRPNVVPNISGK